MDSYNSRGKCAFADCKKKKNHLGIICKCGKEFCMEHRQPEDHDCTFDFKSYDRNKLTKTLCIN